MPFIRFCKPRPAIEVAAGQNLMNALLTAGVPVASSCRGDGVCGKCRVKILSGNLNLSKQTDLEFVLKERHGLLTTERVSCQVSVLDDVTVDTAYW